MQLEFSGAPEITGSRQKVWQKLTDPDFVAASAPGYPTSQPRSPVVTTSTSNCVAARSGADSQTKLMQDTSPAPPVSTSAARR